jgi:predicted phosphodiesterase
VLQDIRRAGVDRIVVGGDVLPGPMPREALELLLALDIPAQFIEGNGDREVVALMRGQETGGVPEQIREMIRWTARQLDREHERVIDHWPKTIRLDIPGLGGVLFCHATPRNDTEIFIRSTPDNRLAPIFEGLGASVVVCGHTHMQFDRTIGDVRVVNAGSVGMPFAEPGAYWLLLGPDIQLRRSSYDLAKAATRIRSTDYPQADDFAAHNVLQPPSEQAMLEAFARLELPRPD